MLGKKSIYFNHDRSVGSSSKRKQPLSLVGNYRYPSERERQARRLAEEDGTISKKQMDLKMPVLIDIDSHQVYKEDDIDLNYQGVLDTTLTL